jgi:hypothetical protein
VRDIELEPTARGVEAEGHIGVVAGLIDWVVVQSKDVRGVAIVMAGGVESLGCEVGGVGNVEFPSVR